MTLCDNIFVMVDSGARAVFPSPPRGVRWAHQPRVGEGAPGNGLREEPPSSAPQAHGEGSSSCARAAQPSSSRPAHQYRWVDTSSALRSMTASVIRDPLSQHLKEQRRTSRTEIDSAAADPFLGLAIETAPSTQPMPAEEGGRRRGLRDRARREEFVHAA
ncbi:hypothetical protein T484DRAFT_1919340 [Baffinella frigidus]|nr:hypothetical protein T484DRAFT_1919340 [Cryptophyta sp. CCMP2293]